MSWEQWFTAAVTVVTVIVLVRDLFPPSVAMTGAMVATLTAGIITPDEALAGFSNPAPVTIAALYVLAKAADKTGALAPLVGSPITPSRTGTGALRTSREPGSNSTANRIVCALLACSATGFSPRTKGTSAGQLATSVGKS